jgi:hypothetical protein
MIQQYRPFSPEEAKSIIEWYEQHQGQRTGRKVSELIGEMGSEKTREEMGRGILLSSVDKSVKQGYDAVDYDAETGQTIVIEDKGIRSTESKLQKDEMHCVRQAEIALYGEKYHANKISETEIGVAQEVIEAHNKGNLGYEVYQTTIENGELVTNLIKKTQPNGELSSNFSDRSSPSELTYESPEDTLIRRETAIAAANQALESGNLSPKKEQEIRELLAEITSPQPETSLTEVTSSEKSVQGESQTIPFEKPEDEGSNPENTSSESQRESLTIPWEKTENEASSPENLPSEPQKESQTIPFEVSNSETTSTMSNSESYESGSCQETTGSESESSSTLY